MRKPNYRSGDKVILVTNTQGLKKGLELKITSHYIDDEYQCVYFKNNIQNYCNLFEDEFRIKVPDDDKKRSSDFSELP